VDGDAAAPSRIVPDDLSLVTCAVPAASLTSDMQGNPAGGNAVRFRGWDLLALLFLACLLTAAGPAAALTGLAKGHVGLIDTNSRAYGFSSTSGRWTPVVLTGPAEAKAAADYLGYLRTAQKLYVYNSTNDHWYSIVYTGQVRGEDLCGATAVVWTTTSMYAIASNWAIWRALPFQPDEVPLGGGSASSFGLFWTNKRGYAFHSASGTWMPQPIPSRAISGIANDGFGLLWNAEAAFSYDPTPGAWDTLDLGGMEGISAAGGGSVGLVWGENRAQAYSGTFDCWNPIENSEPFLGGAAGGDVAILWDTNQAHCYNSETDTWSSVVLQANPAGLDGPGQIGGFSVAPNPSQGEVTFRLPTSGAWKIELFDVNGAVVRRLDTDTREKGDMLSWDGLDGDGHRVAAGTYWARAESAERQVEARRVVMLR
jgi:hypothetical protein